MIDAARAGARCWIALPTTRSAIDLPKPFDPDDPASRPVGDPYEDAARRIDAWRAEGVLVADAEDAVWALAQDYTAPDGTAHTRHGVLVRVRVEDYETGTVRPHERTHPGPLRDRLELTRATRLNLSPIFSLSTEDPWPLVEPALSAEPWGEVTDADGTVNRVWRVADPAVVAAVVERLADAQLLIADGHHRYETARAYRDEVGGEGPQNYTLMALTGLDDPGLTVFPTHRLLSGFAGDPARRERLLAGLRELFEVTEVDARGARPGRRRGRRRLRPLRRRRRQARTGSRLRDTAALDAPPRRANPRPTAGSTRRSSRRWC